MLRMGVSTEAYPKGLWFQALLEACDSHETSRLWLQSWLKPEQRMLGWGG